MVPRRRAVAFFRGALRAVLALVLGVAVLLSAALYALRFRGVQALVLPRINATLSGVFPGKLEIERLGAASFDGVRGLDARVSDSGGHELIAVRGADVSLFWPSLLVRLLVSRPKVLEVELRRVTIDHVHVQVLEDASNTLTLVRAFVRESALGPSPTAHEQQVRLLVRSAEIRHAWVDGKVGALPIDGELVRVRGSLEVAPDRFTLDATCDVELRALPGGPTRGHFALGLGLPSAPSSRKRRLVSARFRGTLLGADGRADFTLQGDRARGTVELPRVDAASLSALSRALAPREPLALRAELHGDLPELSVTLQSENRDGRLGLDARLDVEKKTLTAKLQVSALNLGGFVAALPETALTCAGDLDLRVEPNGLLSGSYRLESQTLTIAGVEYPTPKASGTFSHASQRGLDAQGVIQLTEPGIRAEVRHELSRVGTRGGSLTLQVQGELVDPPRFARFFSGRGALSGEGHIATDPGTLSARVGGELEHVQSAAFKAQRVELVGSASGSLSNPALSVRVTGSETSLFEHELERLVVTLDGTREDAALVARVDAKKPTHVDASARLSLASELVFKEPRISVRDGPSFTLALHAKHFALGQNRRELEGLALSGAGNAQLSLLAGERVEKLELSTQALELSEILGHLGVEQPVSLDGLNLEARYSDGVPRGPLGVLTGNVRRVQYQGVPGGSVRVDLAFSDRTAVGTLEADLGDGGTLVLTAEDLRLPERFDTAPTLADLGGELRASGHFDLTRLEPLLTRLVPVSQTRGKVDLDARLDRSHGTHLALRVAGRGLGGTLSRGEKARPQRLEELDLNGGAELDLASFAARAQATVGDPEGVLLSAEASASPSGAPGSRGFFREAPLKARVLLLPRALHELPPLLRPKSLRGVLGLDLELTGTLANPRLRAHGTMNCLRSSLARASVDLELDADYARSGGELRGKAFGDRATRGQLETRWDGDLLELRSARGPSPVRADVSLELDRFPIELLPSAARHDLSGAITGKVELEGLGRDARLSVELKSQALDVGPILGQPLSLSLSTQEGRLHGQFSLGDAQKYARVELTSPIAWGDQVLPSLEPQLNGGVYARNFELGTLLPWVASDVSELAGTVNANLKAHVSKEQSLLEGTLWLERGLVQIPAIGQRFSDIQAKLSVNRGNVRLESFSAHGTTGRLDASGRATLEGLTVKSAEGRLEIDRDDKIPVTVQGAAIGYAWGNLRAKLDTQRNDHGTHIQVDVPELHVELPSNDPASLQDLAPEPSIRAGTRLSNGAFVALPIEPPSGAATRGPSAPGASRIEVQLGQRVWIERGDQLEVQVGGKLLLDARARTPVQGTIELRDGTLDVRGKRFQIERGSVNFSGPDPNNPTITALARWDSPDGYTVIAEYSGTARQGKLNLRSEPSLTENEILTLLLFGSPEGSAGAQPGLEKTAIGLASGTVVQSFNHVISSLTNLDVSARIDTSTGSSRPEISLQLSPRLTARVTFAIGSPTVGQAPDRTFLTVDFRLKRAWSLSTTVGDKGASALDLIWRKRY